MTEIVEGDPPQAEPEPAEPGRRSTRNAVEWVAIVVGALVVALIVKTFLLQAFFIPSGSMMHTLEEGDRVLVNKLSYKLHDINHGDVIVFERPANVPDDGIKDLIKRVIAVGGETIEARDNQVYVNGKAIDEGYLDEGVVTDDFGPVEVPDGHLFVMGDNRTNSSDSRMQMGPIDEDLVVGRAFVRVWPLLEIDLL